jgi:transposase-like protein
MGQILHGCARTTQAVRRAIQHSQASIASLADIYNLNPKTVAKWKKRTFVTDAPMGPKKKCSTVLSTEEEAICVAFRKHSLLPLDDCLYALHATIPHLSRSSLHRCFQRHGISRLPEIVGEKTSKKKFKSYPIGYFHIDIAEVRTEEGKLYLFVAIDRTSKFAYVELLEKYGKIETAQFLRNLLRAVPYKIHTILTDNGIWFTNRKVDRFADVHIFDRVCLENGIEHRLTKINHPWTNGQVERMNRTIKEATVKKYHYQNHDQLRKHLSNFLNAYNFAKRLKTLKGLTPYEYVVTIWKSEPHLFIFDPTHFNMGLNTFLDLVNLVRTHQVYELMRRAIVQA